MSEIARELLIEALSMGRSKVSKRVRQRVATGLCIVPGCNEEAVGRGLCQRHKNEFYYRLGRIKTKVAQLEFEQAAIRRGLLLPVRAQLVIKKEDASVFCTDAESA